MPEAGPPATDVLVGVGFIAAAGSDTCAVTVAGGIRCWGLNDNGQADRTTTAFRSPPTMDLFTGMQAVAPATEHTCALSNAGGVRCWGANGYGQLGFGYHRSPTAVLLCH